jgi:hypothetical protein
MKTLLTITVLGIGLLFLAIYYEQGRDPYEEGMHLDYKIEIVNGFVYKSLDRHRGTIQVLNSDGTPLRDGKKIY